MLVFEFVHRIIDVLTDYLGDVSESSIRENFVTVYQVRIKWNRLYGKEVDCIWVFVVIGRNDGLWLSSYNRTQRIKRNYHATYNYEQNDDYSWCCCRVKQYEKKGFYKGMHEY